jgi:glycine/D-amino acid oxidase-like deaminating enzyme
VTDDPAFDDNQAVWLVGAPATEHAPPLARDLTCDVAIVGGGFTGVSTAYHLSRRFPELGIALLEARALGNGASGRNGGLMLTGVTPGRADPAQTAREHELTRGAIDRLLALIRDRGLAVRHRRDAGVLRLATSARAAEEAHAEVEALARLGVPLEFLDRRALDARFPARIAHGAVLDPAEGMINGVDLIRAMRPLLVAQGVQLFEATPVTAIREGTTHELTTAGGTVRARALVLATNGYTPRLGYFRTGILPVLSHVVATDPLPRALLDRTGFTAFAGCHDDLPRLAYASVDPDGRMIFGGGSNTSYGYRFGNRTTAPAHLDDRAARAIRRTMTRYFPDLEDVPIRHRWTGPLGLTLPRHCAMGVMGDAKNVYYALGYSGHGIVLANLAGEVLADLYAGDHARWRDHAFYMKRPSGIPPEPLRWLGYQAFTRLTGRSPFRRIR